MVINIKKLKVVEPVDVNSLREWHTGSLLTRLKKLRRMDISYSASDLTIEENDAVTSTGMILFKDTEIWKEAFADVKLVLSEREHIPRGCKAKRQAAANFKRNR